MSESLRKKLVFGLLAVTVIWGIWNNPFQSDVATDPDIQPVDSSSAPIDTLAGRTEGPTEYVEYSAPESWAGDPFPRSRAREDVSFADAPEAALNLTAISASGGTYMAIINGSVVSVNSSIEGWNVTSISQKEVVLQKAGRKRTLKVGR